MAELQAAARRAQELRDEAVHLQSQVAGSERLAALNSEMRLINMGAEGLRAEQARLAPLAAQAQVGRQAPCALGVWCCLPAASLPYSHVHPGALACPPQALKAEVARVQDEVSSADTVQLQVCGAALGCWRSWLRCGAGVDSQGDDSGGAGSDAASAAQQLCHAPQSG